MYSALYPRGHDILIWSFQKKPKNPTLKTFPVSLQTHSFFVIGVTSSAAVIKGESQRPGFGLSARVVHSLSTGHCGTGHMDATSAGVIPSWIFEMLIFYLFEGTKAFLQGRL